VPDGETGERDRILAAAWDVLGRTSYENLKIQAVIRVAGVSIGGFYRYFDGKQELVAELLRIELDRATAILDEHTADGTPEDRVRAWVDAIVSLAFGRTTGPRARWFTSLPLEVRTMVDEGERIYQTAASLEAAIADGRASGVFPGADPHRDARLVHSLCVSLDRSPIAWLGDDREQAVARVADFVVAALANPTRHRTDASDPPG
jgi:AcrR family transcriptional regulator